MDTLTKFNSYDHIKSIEYPNDPHNTFKKMVLHLLFCDLKNMDESLCVFNIDNHDDMKSCITCSHSSWRYDVYCLYDELCSVCVNRKLINNGSILPFVPRQIFYNYGNCWITLSYFGFRKHFPITILNHDETVRSFIDNPKKLIYKFYHKTSIIFLMSTHDGGSSCYELNSDIRKYILGFIY